MKSTVYLETTFVSLLTAWPSRVLVRAAHQQSTRDWWKRRRGDFDLFVSGLVLDEVKSGDPQAAQERMKAITGLPVLTITGQAIELTERILATKCIPAKAAIADQIESACTRAGFRCPVICTPDELMGD